uniref:Uncharacterized protein n=1 Tax=Anopheles minimus TaxID=112268 RepID=A0A182WPJ9_9DIPT
MILPLHRCTSVRLLR